LAQRHPEFFDSPGSFPQLLGEPAPARRPAPKTDAAKIGDTGDAAAVASGGDRRQADDQLAGGYRRSGDRRDRRGPSRAAGNAASLPTAIGDTATAATDSGDAPH
jgi:hypothetical protein